VLSAEILIREGKWGNEGMKYKAICEKCGMSNPEMEYHKDGSTCAVYPHEKWDVSSKEEHLHCICKRCGYEWISGLWSQTADSSIKIKDYRGYEIFFVDQGNDLGAVYASRGGEPRFYLEELEVTLYSCSHLIKRITDDIDLCLERGEVF